MIILDTNVVSELRKVASDRCDLKVSRWASLLDISNTYISVITVLEIELGIQHLSRRDNDQATNLQTWFDQLMRLYDKRLVPVDKHVAIRAASLHVPDPKPERDAIIAATALVYGFSLATRNTQDFETLDLALINPWKHNA